MPSPSVAKGANGANSGIRGATREVGARHEEDNGERGHAAVRSGILNGQRKGMAGSMGNGSTLKRGLKRLSLHKAARNEEHGDVLNEGIAVFCDDSSGKRTHATLRVRQAALI